ncbi:DUF4192 domain-containing protein [Kitasatospora cineracea]|uniref:Uncharacterized protein DUF4192 n=1 Tax=Kitasatospora cineracea TaxID=88074 RepID=A0A8G1UF96_9ACTN|nr:DUF4192 domain-containing protein [Kitasatospora cineracea]ROR42910.1 uncharacterized protein DUF4192 [Kitasatospora cineracea]
MLPIQTIPQFDISNLVQAAEALPYLLGHQPDGPEPVVFIVSCDTTEQRVLFSQRIGIPPELEDLHGAASELIHFALAKLGELDTTAAGVLIFVLPGAGEPDDRTSALGRHYALAHALGSSATSHNLEVLANLCVTSTHWWSYEHADPADLPAGTPLHGPHNPGPVTMDAVFKGIPVPPSEAGMHAAFTPAAGDDAEPYKAALLQAAVDRARREKENGVKAEIARARATLDRLLMDGGDGAPLSDLAPIETAELILALRHRPLRDYACQFVEPTELPRAQELWSLLARRCVSDRTVLAAAPLTLAGFTAAANGDFLSAGIALRRAVKADQMYRLAGLVLDLISQTNSVDPLLAIAREERAHRNVAD